LISEAGRIGHMPGQFGAGDIRIKVSHGQLLIKSCELVDNADYGTRVAFGAPTLRLPIDSW
jgi:hypothetical protein